MTPAATVSSSMMNRSYTLALRNTTFHHLEDITLDINFAWLLCALASAMILVIYITYYNSRVVGFILTKLTNHLLIKNGYFKMGSFSVSVLSGKIMFRDIAYVTHDYSVRIQDGWIIFRWWRNYIKRDISEDMSHSDTRLSLLLNGLEVHMYNRSSAYNHLEKLFGLESTLFVSGDETHCDNILNQSTTEVSQTIQQKGIEWRDLIPVIKAEISCGRLVFGNRLLPNTLLINVEEAHIMYTTKPASSRLDQFMHVVKCKAENFKVILAPSPKYTGMVDEPPRFMGEGFVVLQSNRVDLYYYMDEPGVEPEEPEMVQMANGDIIPQQTSPAWGVEIKCGKGTDFSYGPWADRQREELYKFFFPQDYQPMQVTRIPKPGELRMPASFDVRLSTLSEATVDILFSKNKETSAIHMNVGPGSYLEVTVPWITGEQGYTSRINGQFLHSDATTSLQYRSLFQSETLEFDVKIAYPLHWNAHQDWTCNLTGCKATVNFIYEHKSFFQDLMVDWASKARPDLLRFIPYTWHFNIIIKEFELVTIVNEYNWIDCSSQNPENAHIAFCGEVFDLSFDLPFTEFIPKTIPLKFWLQGESVDLVLYLPEVNTSQNIIIALNKNCKLTNRDGSEKLSVDNEKKWRNMASKSNYWIDCWTVPIVALSVDYTYHPVPPLGPRSHELEYTTPEKEEILLLPIRPPVSDDYKPPQPSVVIPENFNPMSLPADKINVELEIGPSVMYLYGSVLRGLMNFKENYFGEDQKFVEMDTSHKTSNTSKHNETFDDGESSPKEFDPRIYRPMEITVTITMHDIQGHMMMNCQKDDPPCPALYLERFVFEMQKTYLETCLQLVISPLVMSVTDKLPRPCSQSHLRDGHMALSGLQVRGHAMFSDNGRSLDDETLEYAWLIEIQIGDIMGRLTVPQVHRIITGLETFVFLVQDEENSMQHPIPHKFCQHQLPQPQCNETDSDFFCPTVEDIKYKMTRLSIDNIDLYVVESGTALSVQLNPVRFATCNLHGHQTRSGMTVLVQNMQLRQYVMINPLNVGLPTNHSHATNDVWLEAGAVLLGPIFVDGAQALTHQNMHIVQNKFLKQHDNKTKKLWFLWSTEESSVSSKVIGKCGCVGGCTFVGNNLNGVYFFHPSTAATTTTDEHALLNTASFQIVRDKNYFGYGQSLLHPNQLVFDFMCTEMVMRSDFPKRNVCSGDSNLVSSSGDHPKAMMKEMKPSDSCDTFLTEDNNMTSSENLKDLASRQNSYETTTSSMVSTQEVLQFSMTDSAPVDSSLDVQEERDEHSMMTMSPSPTSIFEDISKSLDLSMPASTSIGSFVDAHQTRKGSLISESKLSIETTSQGGNPLQVSVPSLVSLQGQNSARRDSRTSLNGHPPLPIAKSSSRQSLGSSSMRPGSIARSPNTVRRAQSTGSDSAQSSDIFFSTEELGHLTPEEQMLLPHYVVGEHHLLRRNNDGSKRSLQDIQEQSLQDSNPTLVQTIVNSGEGDHQDTHSVSSTSFISALSSQEDLAMVDLHMQLNRPITESPLLMSCYTCHMTKLHCNHGCEPPPLPHIASQNNPSVQKATFAYLCKRWTPEFHRISEGFTSIKMVEKHHQMKDQKPPPAPAPFLYSDSPTHPHPWDFESIGQENETNDDELKSTYDSSISKMTLVIKLKGEVDFFISPLLLETTQRFIEAITPTLSKLHPLTVVNHLHAKCSRSVQSMNNLKKEKYMYFTQLREARKSVIDGKKVSGQVSPTSSTYEETQLSRFQAFTKLSKVNIYFLQASIVEEVISFSALDNVRDLTCVSLLAICFDSLSGQVYTSSRSKKAIHTYTDDSPDSSLRVKVKDGRSKKAKMEWSPSEPMTIETTELQQEEKVAKINIGKVHIQLRRMKNSSSVLKDAMLTVIPKRHSKVLFTFDKMATSKVLSCHLSDRDRMDAFGMHDPSADLDEDKMGFIMFECGFENYMMKMVKRTGFENAATTDVNCSKSQDTLASPSSPAAECPERKNGKTPYVTKKKTQTNPMDGGDDSSKREALSHPEKADKASVDSASIKENVNVISELKGDASSCIIDLKTVWFNFAAPPHTPNTRKIDFTRLDWHLLSTASPAITSWMNPSDRLFVSVKKMTHELAHRETAIMTCLMIEALDMQGIHVPIKGKYHKLKPLSKTLKEDPSCQLLTVLCRFINRTDLAQIEENLSGEFVPNLATLQQGLLSTCRQWKPILYMPLLVEQKFKLRKNVRPLVSFALPLVESIQNMNEDLDASMDECEITDEKTLLLKAEGGSFSAPCLVKEDNVPSMVPQYSGSSSSSSASQQELTEGGMSISTLSMKPRKRLPSYMPRSSRASIAFPVPGNTLESPMKAGGNVGVTYFSSGIARPTHSKVTSHGQLPVRLKHQESNYSLHSETCSVSTIDPNIASSSLGTPQRYFPEPQQEDEDLYNWMVRQQDYMKGNNSGTHKWSLVGLESNMNTLTTEHSGDEEVMQSYQSPTLNFAPLNLQVTDTHIIFDPLLTSLGVPSNVNDMTICQKLGPNASISGSLDLLRIDIVESDAYRKRKQKPGKFSQDRLGMHSKFFVDMSMETPAFLCDKLVVDIEFREFKDMEKICVEESANSKHIEQLPVIFTSNDGLKKHNTTAVNFSLHVTYISQQVNMPLLRLLHQFFSMYQNVCETRIELKENRPAFHNTNFMVHKKQDSSSGSESQQGTAKASLEPTVTDGSTLTPTPKDATLVIDSSTLKSQNTCRPQSLTQRLRVSSKGYTNLNDRGSPLSLNFSESVAIDVTDLSVASEKTMVEHIKENMPKCWRNIYHLLDLYAMMPVTKTVSNRSPVALPDVSEGYKGNGKYEPLKEHKIDVDEPDGGDNLEKSFSVKRKLSSTGHKLQNLKKSIIIHERVSLVVFGTVNIRRTRLLATLSGLKLEAELSTLHSTITYTEKVKGANKKWNESSVTGHLGKTMIVLLEGIAPNLQTVVKVTVGKNQVLYSSHSKHAKDKNAAGIFIGPVNIDIPQHPVVLHGMMTRGSKQLSTTLQELRASRMPPRMSRTTEDLDTAATRSPKLARDQAFAQAVEPQQKPQFLKPIAIQFNIVLDSLTIGASLLPSLQAEYRMDQVTSSGITGSKAKFTVSLPKHTLSFATKVQSSEANLPSSASVDLPPVHLSAEYIQQGHSAKQETWDAQFADGVVLREGGYLSAVAEIGCFEHSLSTDLLNHLVFVQKVFMKEVNEIVQKMSGSDKVVPLWGEEEKSQLAAYQLLYTLQLRLKGIQITATTPTNSALRLETGILELQLSNRVQNMSAGKKTRNSSAKLFGKAHVDLILSLGQLLKNALFEEAEPEFQQFAYFKTRIALRNALQDEMISSQSGDKEAVLITLHRPLVYIQPIALDKAVIVWLNYKNAYEYWNEQRANLNKEVLTATQQVFEKVPPIAQLSSQSLGTLFLQLTIDDMGMCLPMNPDTTSISISRQMYDTEPRAACVITLESTRISACSSGSLVSKGKFSSLCIRFADDFETSLDDWKPDPNDSNIMNLCIVLEGTYEVCSRTVVNQGTENAKWILNVQWQMEGVDIHVDNNIGKQLSSLANTLTSLAGYEEDKEGTELDYDLGMNDQGQGTDAQDAVLLRKPHSLNDTFSGYPLDNQLDAKKRSRLIEKEMNEQAKIVNDLKTLGASQSTIEQEIRRLQELESAVFNDFRRDVIKKLRRQSVRQASSIKDKLGLGSKSTSHLRSISVVIPHSPSTENPFNNLPSPPGASLTTSSVDSSPTQGHTRTVSFDGANLSRVTFDDSSSIVRQYAMNLALGSTFDQPNGLDKEATTSAYNPLSSHLHHHVHPTKRGIRRIASYHPNTFDLHSPSSTSESSPTANTTHSELTADSDLDRDVFPPPLLRDNSGFDNKWSIPSMSSCHAVHERSASIAAPSTTPSTYKTSAPEPNIDFELDVKVFIDSGKCVLHTKEFCREDERNKSFKKERSFSNSTFDFPTSPGNRKRSTSVRPATSTTKLKHLPAPVQTVDFIVFLIPGLDVKVHYNSKTLCGESPVMGAPRSVSVGDLSLPESQNLRLADGGPLGVQRKPGIKKATLFAWLTLQSIPEECIITPQILDFLEQALEPIPIPLPTLKSTTIQSDPMESMFELHQDTVTGSFTAPATYVYASFPVDVTVYFRMQPSTLRFSCLPVSRVECLLRLPSLDLVISSKRAEEEIHLSEFADTSIFQRTKVASGQFFGREYPRRDSGARSQQFPNVGDFSSTAVGGLSVTGCLSDFSLYIFHPYGGKKAGLSVGTTRNDSTDSSPLSDSERKDSLSLQVEFVKVNISRSRKINLNVENPNITQQKPTGRGTDPKGAVIRFSAICDIGSASFKYDMRRLTEILAFPKAWYRRSIVRRLFLGDLSTAAFYSDQEDSVENSSTPSSPLTPDSVTSKSDVFTFSHLPRSLQSSVQISSPPVENVHSPASAPSVPCSQPTSDSKDIRERLYLNLQGDHVHRSKAAPDTPRSEATDGLDISDAHDMSVGDHASPNQAHMVKSSNTWETLVLFAVNLSKLNVHMNMGNVMGNTMWTTRDTSLQGCLSIGSSGHKNMFMSLGLGGSSLDAKGGIVGGTIELSHIDTYLHFKEDPGMEPDHKMGLKLFALEARLDYMGTSMLMVRVSSLDVTLRDEWRINIDTESDPTLHPTKRPALIFIHGNLGWDQLQLIISKSTTADLLKMYSKLEEFFTQQFKSSKRVFSSLQPRMPRQMGKRQNTFTSKAKKRKVGEGARSKDPEARHHRHWQKVLAKVSGMQLATLSLPLPKHGTILGGTMELKGNHISLACFHDINFRAKHWALFSLREPNISFATEAQNVVNPGAIDTHIIQNLQFSLGHNITEHAQHTRMATVCRISRNYLFPPQFRTMKEWFHYAFYISELDEVDRFPSLERDRSDSVSTERHHQRSASKGQDFNHAMECIFSLPTLQFLLKTEHMQAEQSPDLTEDKPLVECSFVTEFEDHIFVTVDAEAFSFIYDLITAYIKEKDRTTEKGSSSHTPEGEGDRKRNKLAHPTESLQKDWRNYSCKTWHLEPTVRLLSWGGKNIEPYGVDYILQRLGFHHARTTIPKWVQRGTMDPLDKILSILMGKMIDVVREEKDAH